MKVIAVIEPACADTADRRPAVIRQILDHLGLASTPPSFRAPPDQPDGGAAERPREWAYEPLFDDLAIPDPPCLPAGRCSDRRGRWTGPFRLAPRSLRI